MNEFEFKTAYRASEDSVPVNNELKKKLIEMAKAYDIKEEDTPSIKIVSTNNTKKNTAEKRRVRSNIMKIAALAACFTLCVVSAPQISRYMDSGEIDPQYPIVGTPVPNNGETDNAGQKEENASDNQTNAVSDGSANGAASNNAGGLGVSSVGRPAGSNQTGGSGESYNPSAEQNGAGANAPTDTSTNNAPNTNTAVNPPVVDPGKDTKPGKDIEPVSGEMTTHDEFNNMLEILGNQRSKLSIWETEISPYKDADEFIGMYYESFVISSEKYISAADLFETKYASASDESGYSAAISEYNSALSEDSELYSDCRAAYRKAANYIEMNDLENIESEPESYEPEPEVTEDEI